MNNDDDPAIKMPKSPSIENILEIFLITYNRAPLLENTLRQLSESPFRHCRFTVLDNKSTDDTSRVATAYSNRFSDYHIVRHNRNIGGDYNYLRAVELSTYLYTWVLCDDDNYDFTNADDIIAAIESCKYDLIYVASRQVPHLGWDGCGASTVRQLIDEDATYHRACAFWPALIFKSADFDTHCYVNAPRLFPSILFITKTIQENYSIYVAREELIFRNMESVMEMSPLFLFKEWVKNAGLLKEDYIKEKIIEQWTEQGFIKTLAFWIAMEKSSHVESFWPCLSEIFFGLSSRLRFKFVLLLPVILIPLPRSFLIKARRVFYRMLGRKNIDELPPVSWADR